MSTNNLIPTTQTIIHYVIEMKIVSTQYYHFMVACATTSVAHTHHDLHKSYHKSANLHKLDCINQHWYSI
jgi:cobalamin-dependent methionine synthase I